MSNTQKPKWTGQLIGKMHTNGITQQMIADQLGVTKAYVSMVLNGTKTPKNARLTFYAAFNQIIENRR